MLPMKGEALIQNEQQPHQLAGAVGSKQIVSEQFLPYGIVICKSSLFVCAKSTAYTNVARLRDGNNQHGKLNS